MAAILTSNPRETVLNYILTLPEEQQKSLLSEVQASLSRSAPSEAAPKKIRAPMSEETKAKIRATRALKKAVAATAAPEAPEASSSEPAPAAPAPSAAPVEDLLAPIELIAEAPAAAEPAAPAPKSRKPRAPMSDEAKAAMAAKRAATVAAKKANSSASSVISSAASIMEDAHAEPKAPRERTANQIQWTQALARVREVLVATYPERKFKVSVITQVAKRLRASAGSEQPNPSAAATLSAQEEHLATAALSAAASDAE